MTATLNRVPFVQWDRFVPSGRGGWTVYGWIGRADGRADFVLLDLDTYGDAEHFVTSSAARSRDIAAALGWPDRGHVDCLRVEAELPAVRNAAQA